MKDAISIFIMPPSYDELKRRLTGRGTDSIEVINQRLSASLSEIERAKEYDYIVTNDIVDRAVDDILHIILANRLTYDRQKDFINEVLEKC
jgi:guanylate kinase